MPSLADISYKLKADGWRVSEQSMLKELEAEEKSFATYQEVHSFLLNCDLKDVVDNKVADDTTSNSKKASSVNGPLVVQVCKIRNVCCPKAAEGGEAMAGRLLRVTLTDGNAPYHAIELNSCPAIGLGTAPGTKLLLTGRIPQTGGFLLLSPKHVTVMGGRVTALYEKWNLTENMLCYSTGMQQSSDGNSKPPPWLPFSEGGRANLLSNGTTLGGKFKSLKEAAKDTQEEDAGKDRFSVQRKQAVQEIVKGSSVGKVFGGGRHMPDAAVARVVAAGFSADVATWALGNNSNDASAAIGELRAAAAGQPIPSVVRRDSSTTSGGRGHDRRGGARGRGRGRGRGSGGPDDSDDDYEMRDAPRPSGPASLFDFFDAKMAERNETAKFVSDVPDVRGIMYDGSNKKKIDDRSQQQDGFQRRGGARDRGRGRARGGRGFDNARGRARRVSPPPDMSSTQEWPAPGEDAPPKGRTDFSTTYLQSQAKVDQDEEDMLELERMEREAKMRAAKERSGEMPTRSATNNYGTTGRGAGNSADSNYRGSSYNDNNRGSGSYRGRGANYRSDSSGAGQMNRGSNDYNNTSSNYRGRGGNYSRGDTDNYRGNSNNTYRGRGTDYNSRGRGNRSSSQDTGRPARNDAETFTPNASNDGDNTLAGNSDTQSNSYNRYNNRGRGRYDNNTSYRGGYSTDRGGYSTNKESYDGNNAGFGADSKGSYDGGISRGNYDSNNRGSYNNIRGSYDHSRGNYDHNRGNYRGGHNYNRGGGYDTSSNTREYDSTSNTSGRGYDGSSSNVRGDYDSSNTRGGYSSSNATRSYNTRGGGYSPGDYDSNTRGGRGSYRDGGGYNTGRGGYNAVRGSYETGRGSYETGRGSYDTVRGSYETGRGSYDTGRGSYETGRGSYDTVRGSYETRRDSYDTGRGGYDTGRGGYNAGRGGYDGSQRGGHHNSGGYGGFYQANRGSSSEVRTYGGDTSSNTGYQLQDQFSGPPKNYGTTATTYGGDVSSDGLNYSDDHNKSSSSNNNNPYSNNSSRGSEAAAGLTRGQEELIEQFKKSVELQGYTGYTEVQQQTSVRGNYSSVEFRRGGEGGRRVRGGRGDY